MEIFKLFGSVLVETDKAEASIQKADNKAKKFAEGLANVGKTALAIGGAVAGMATAAGKGLYELTQKVSDVADEFDKASLRTGIEVENLQKLKYAAEQSGVELSTLEKSATTMNKQLAALGEGGKAGEAVAETFDRLGVSVYDASGNMRDTNDVYNDTLTKLADMGDTAETTALGTQIFGKSFSEMKPLLASGSEGIEDLKNRASELGLVMSGESVTGAVVLGDTIADIKSAFDGFINQIGTALVPIMQEFADIIIENLPFIQEMVTNFVPVIAELANQILPILMDAINNILPMLFDLLSGILPIISDLIVELLPIFVEILASLLPPITEIIQQILPVIVELITLLLPPLAEVIKELMPAVVEVLNALMPIIEVVLEILKPILGIVVDLLPALTPIIQALTPLISLVSNLLNTLLIPLMPIIEGLASIITGVLGDAFGFITEQVGNVTKIFGGIIDFLVGVFTGDWGKAWGGISSIFEGIFNGIKAFAEFVVNGLIKMVNGLIDGINFAIGWTGLSIGKLSEVDWTSDTSSQDVQDKYVATHKVTTEKPRYNAADELKPDWLKPSQPAVSKTTAAVPKPTVSNLAVAQSKSPPVAPKTSAKSKSDFSVSASKDDSYKVAEQIAKKITENEEDKWESKLKSTLDKRELENQLKQEKFAESKAKTAYENSLKIAQKQGTQEALDKVNEAEQVYSLAQKHTQLVEKQLDAVYSAIDKEQKLKKAEQEKAQKELETQYKKNQNAEEKAKIAYEKALNSAQTKGTQEAQNKLKESENLYSLAKSNTLSAKQQLDDFYKIAEKSHNASANSFAKKVGDATLKMANNIKPSKSSEKNENSISDFGNAVLSMSKTLATDMENRTFDEDIRINLNLLSKTAKEIKSILGKINMGIDLLISNTTDIKDKKPLVIEQFYNNKQQDITQIATDLMGLSRKLAFAKGGI